MSSASWPQARCCGEGSRGVGFPTDFAIRSMYSPALLTATLPCVCHIRYNPVHIRTNTTRGSKRSLAEDSAPNSIAGEASEALQARRYPATLLAQLVALDEAAIRADPWVALFQGRRLCRLHSRFAEATELIGGALEAFRARG